MRGGRQRWRDSVCNYLRTLQKQEISKTTMFVVKQGCDE